MKRTARNRRWIGLLMLGLTALYALLLLPERDAPVAPGAGQKPFVWARDEIWTNLENQFRVARQMDGAVRNARFTENLEQVQRAADEIAATNLPPNAAAFDAVETAFFQLAPFAATVPERSKDFLLTASRLAELAKWQSESWPVDSPEARQRIYRLLFGCRAALEEVMLQRPRTIDGLELATTYDHDATPSAEVQGVQMHSGDILVSRGGAATSALIARGNDFPGNFSHIALVHVDEATKKVSVIESHIESGVGVRPIEAYLADTKLRIMVLRLRSSLTAVRAQPMLSHQVATAALTNALAHHIPYDFAMDHDDPAKQFCSEVASAAYRTQGITLWSGLSQISSPGLRRWLSALGVRNFESQQPSDLEYDPQLRVVAEWRNPETLFKDHVDNAVIDALLETAEQGAPLDYNRWMLPAVRLAKAWSVLLNVFGKVGPIPEGMSATTALRVDRLTKKHAATVRRVQMAAEQFQQQNGYVPPGWDLLQMARDAIK